jgi:hypothetical protein
VQIRDVRMMPIDEFNRIEARRGEMPYIEIDFIEVGHDHHFSERVWR